MTAAARPFRTVLLAVLCASTVVAFVSGCGDATVPDVKPGASLDEAKSAISQAGFRSKVAWTSDATIAAGSVVSITPAAGTPQPDGSTVTVELSSGQPFSEDDVLSGVTSVNLTDGPREVDPSDILNSSDLADNLIAVGDTPAKCWGVEPGDVTDATAGSGDSSSGGTLTVAILKTRSVSTAQRLVEQQRAAQAACVASSPLTWQTSPYGGSVSFASTNASTALVGGYPAYLTSGAVTSTDTGGGQAFRGAEVMWQQGRYLLLARDQEMLGATVGTYGYPGAPSGAPSGLDQAVGELRSAMSAELSRVRRDASARKAVLSPGQTQATTSSSSPPTAPEQAATSSATIDSTEWASFRTPEAAALCEVADGSSVYCWTPNDGFSVNLMFLSPPKTSYDASMKGRTEQWTVNYATDEVMWSEPDGTLGFGQSWRYSGSGEPRFNYVCKSESTGLTCDETISGHGFWLGRYKGYRVY